MKRGHETILLMFIGVLAGFAFAAALLCYNSLKLEPSLTAGNVLQAFATISIGVLVASYFQRIIHVDRKEKDIVLRHLDLLLDVVAEFEEFKEGGQLTKVTALLKKLSVKEKAIYDLLVSINYPKLIIDQCRFDDHIRNMRSYATDTPITEIKNHAKKTRCASIVRNGIIQLAEEKSALLDVEIQKMKLDILKAQISINRAT